LPAALRKPGATVSVSTVPATKMLERTAFFMDFLRLTPTQQASAKYSVTV